MTEKEKLRKLKELLKTLKSTHEGDRQIINDMYEVMITHAINAMGMKYGNLNMFKEER